MNKIKITHATVLDFEVIQSIARQTFLEAFAGDNTEADMKQYLQENFSAQKIKTELGNPDSTFFIAREEDIPVGYLKINTGKAQTELKDEAALEIERIYVTSSHYGKKVGQLLYEKALEISRLQHKAYLWLGVWERNARAIRFYEKNGFVPFDKHLFQLGNDEQTDIMMKKTLNPAAMNFSIQTPLSNELVVLLPLKEADFDALYAVAADPRIWEQHPNKDRWKKEIFRNFFDGAMQSGGAFKITDRSTGNIMGSTRFYDYDQPDDSIFIGYTFYGVGCWGKGINLSVKQLMLDYIFRFVCKVKFHIGAENVRSQIAIGRVGAVKIGEQEVTYFGEAPKRNFVYVIEKESRIQ